MPYATWANEDERSGMMIVLPGTDHAHTKGQKNCWLCVSNSKDVMANGFWLYSRRAVQAMQAKITLGMIRIFDHAGKAIPKKLTHSQQRDLERLVKKAKAQKTSL